MLDDDRVVRFWPYVSVIIPAPGRRLAARKGDVAPRSLASGLFHPDVRQVMIGACRIDVAHKNNEYTGFPGSREQAGKPLGHLLGERQIPAFLSHHAVFGDEIILHVDDDDRRMTRNYF